MNEPNWDLYRSFLATLALGSLSAAARELGLTQPTVGRHIEALEAALGQQLFTRSQQGLSPTEAAIQLRPFVETMAATSAALVRAAADAGEETAGTVRISASEVMGVEVIPAIIAGLQDRHPRLEIELSTTDLIEDVLNREADIAVRMAEPTQKALVARHLGAIPIGFHAHRAYLDRHGTPATIADLAHHRLIGFDRQTAFVRAVAERIPAVADARFAFRADSNLAQLAAIRTGVGIGVCQVRLARTDPDLVRLLAAEFEVPLPVWIVMHEDLRSSPRCRATFDALVAGLRAFVEGRPVPAPQT
jgi:DNA-binding transcriptional LysR family regulator